VQVTVLTADLNTAIAQLGLPNRSALVNKTLEITAVNNPANITHSAIGQFRLITAVGTDLSGHTTLTINAPYDLTGGESVADIKSYAITGKV